MSNGRFKNYFQLNSETLGITNRIDLLVFIIGVVFIFVLHWANDPSLPFSSLQPWAIMSLIFIGAFPVVFITNPFSQKPVLRWSVDGFLILMTIIAFGYVVISSETIYLRLGDPDLIDMILYPVAVVTVLEATRRITGLPLVLVTLFFILYAHFGHLIPGRLGHGELDFARITEGIYLGVDGMFGHTSRIMVTIIWYFVALGAFLGVSGAGKAFMDFAFSIGGTRQGGAAQTAVISSALFGTISGSGVANVATTGSFTIPLMKSVGYKPHFAGAVEAAASMGGQITPPVMGSGIFLMSGITGIAYITICKASIIPAILYFFCIFMCVYFESGRLGMTGLPKAQVPKLFSKDILLRAGVPLSTILMIVWILALGYTPRMAAAGSIVWLIALSIIVAVIHPGITMNLNNFLKGLSDGFNSGAGLAAILAAAGICVGVIYFTGIGMKFSNLVLAIGQEHLLLAIFTLMIAALFLGMGLPTPAAYLILAIMAGPALKRLGVDLLSSHLLIFYYAVFAGITPPVGIAYMVAAGIAGADQLKTGITAFFRLAFVGILMPFLWLYKPGIILHGSITEIILTFTTTAIGVWTFSMAVIGFWKRNYNTLLRATLIGTSLVVLFGSIFYQIVAILLIIAISMHNKYGFSLLRGKLEKVS
jgi:TRAP transporter 4TM/12TM fusion protein